MTKRCYRPAIVWAVAALAASAYLAFYVSSDFMQPDVARSFYTTNSQYLLTADSGTSWYNYDHRSPASWSTNVDWPIRYIFTNDATINAVKSGLDGSSAVNCGGRPMTGPVISPDLCASGNSMNHKSTMTNWSGFDADGGIKRGLTGCQMDYHMRLYARPNGFDYNFNLAYGKHVFASVHRDWEGCSPANYFDSLDNGISNSSESWFNNRILNYLGSSSMELATLFRLL